MSKKPNPIPPEIVDYFDYNPETGIITWKISPCHAIKVGHKAGSKRKRSRGKGYEFFIRFNYKYYNASRLAYFLYHGKDPKGKQVDHIDGNPLNNKIDNLRLATGSQNQMNRGLLKNNTSGVVGVYWVESVQKWRAQIDCKNKRIYLGYFDDKEEAIAARIAAEKKYFGEFRNDCNDNV